MMSAGRAASLYTPEILALAVELARYPLSGGGPLTGSARSRSCGSTLEIALGYGEGDRIDALGLKVSACAIGQASAAIFARHAFGTDLARIVATGTALADWLGGAGALPEWPDLSLIAPARDFRGRHGAILLPWKAAEQALSKA